MTEAKLDFIVGRVDPPEQLGRFATEREAAEYIGTLPDHESGIYYLDGPDD